MTRTEVRVALKSQFRFIHEPLPGDNMVVRPFGHEDLVASLLRRISHSSGGAFLLGGFRGCGKTTLVQRVSEQLHQNSDSRRYVIVNVNIARPVTPGELLFMVLRRVYEQLQDDGILKRIPSEAREAISIAYTRTSMAVTIKDLFSREDTSSVSNNFKIGGKGLEVGSSAKQESKSTRSRGRDAAFLTYSDSDAEYDFLRIVQLLRQNPLAGNRKWRKLLRRGSTTEIHLVVIIDELDKLTSDEAGVAAFNTLLTALKNVLNTHGIHVIFVGGTDLLAAASSDAHEKIGIYESMFAWTAYVPCLWNAPSKVLQSIIDDASTADELTAFERYLGYKSRGIPRRLFQELNEYVRWEAERPFLIISAEDADKVELYSELALAVSNFVGDHVGERVSSMKDDEFRVGTFYLTDWILRTEGGLFDPQMITSPRRGIGSVMPVSVTVVEAFLKELLTASIIDQISQDVGFRTQYSSAEAPISYRLSSDIRNKLQRVARTNEREWRLLSERPTVGTRPPLPVDEIIWPLLPDHFSNRPSPYAGSAGPLATLIERSRPTEQRTTFDVHRSPDISGAFSARGPIDPELDSRHSYGSLSEDDANARFDVPRAQKWLGDGHYEVLDILGMGGMSTVLKAKDRSTNEMVAIKLLREQSDATLRERFEREARINMHLKHPNLANVYGVITGQGGELGIVMQLVDGDGLYERIAAGNLTPHQSVRIAAGLLDVVDYIHQQGIVRLDIKPFNVIVRPDGNPTLIDLGTARPDNDHFGNPLNTDADFVGTPAYMAPEQFQRGVHDARSDIFSVGIVLYEMLSGHRINLPATISQIIDQRLTQDVPTAALECSAELRTAVDRMVARNPEDRFPSAHAAMAFLQTTPEAAATTGDE